jgi:hypothetical protein
MRSRPCRNIIDACNGCGEDGVNPFVNFTFILCLALVLSGGLFGCKASSSRIAPNQLGGHNLDDISSHIFGIEGKVVDLRRTAKTLQSITVELIRPLPTALGWVPYDKPGEIIVIHFDESFSGLGSLKLTNGSVVKVAFGFIDNSADLNGSNFKWLFVQETGKFYNIKSEIVDAEPSNGDSL